MVSAKALQYGSTKTAPLMQTDPSEHPVALQIFGGEPASMADAARRCVDFGADLVDLNMGCTVPEGAQGPVRGRPHVRPRPRRGGRGRGGPAVPVPVTVKFRAGLTAGDDSYLELARRLQDAGVAA